MLTLDVTSHANNHDDISRLARRRRLRSDRSQGLFGWLNRRWRQRLDLPNQETLLVRKLIVFRPVFQEPGQEVEKALSVVDEDALDGYRFVRVRYKHLFSTSVKGFNTGDGRFGGGPTLNTWKVSYCTIFRSSRSRFMHIFRWSPRSTYAIMTL